MVRRGQLKASLTRFGTYMRSEIRNITQVKIRRAKIEDNCNKFQQVQVAIEDLTVTNQNENENCPYREEFEEFYFKIAAEAEKLIITSTKKEQISIIVVTGEHTDIQEVT